MNTKEAISNLELIGKALAKAANKQENYNTTWAQHLEEMSWAMHKHANELYEIASLYSGTLD